MVHAVKDGLDGIAGEPRLGASAAFVPVELDFRPLPDDGSRAKQAPEVGFENESIESLSFLDEAIAVLFLGRSREEVLSHLRTANMVPGDRDLLNRQVGQRIREASKLEKSG